MIDAVFLAEDPLYIELISSEETYEEINLYPISLQNLDQLYKVGKSISLFISPDILTSDIIYTLQKQQLQNELFYSIELCSDLQKFKEILTTKSEEIFLNNKSSYLRKESGKIATDLDMNINTRYSVNVQNITESLSADNLLLSLMLDGSYWRLHLNDGIILGFDKKDLDKIDQLPTHIKNYILDDSNVIYASEIAAEHIFLNSCADSLTHNSTYKELLNVPQNLLKKSKTVISGYRVKYGDISENLLHYLLITSGYSLREVHYIMNLNSYLYLQEFSPYILFGNADINRKSLVTKRETLHVKTLSETYIELEKNSNHANCNLYEVTCFIENENFLSKVMNKEIEIELEGNTSDVRVSIIPYNSTKKLKIFIYSWSKINDDFKLTVRIDSSGTQNISKDILSIIDKTKNVNHLKLIGFNHKAIQNSIKNFENTAINTYKFLEDYQVTKNNQKKDKELKKLLKDENSLLNLIYNEIKEKKSIYYLEEKYNEKMSIRSEKIEQQDNMYCPQCKTKIFLKKGFNQLYNYSRLSAICRTCQNVFDTSEINGRISNYPGFTCVHDSGNKIVLEYSINNDKSFKTQNLISVVLGSDFHTNIDDLSKDFIEYENLSLEPNESRIANVTISLPDTVEKVSKDIMVYVYWLNNFDLRVASYKTTLKNF
ncbi:hypothetical protein [Bacillus paranthracis]|uniref:hypothetical protein n=1 Tax=Bacillus paranthracis TaxID=2026186 RepID=UPI0039A3F1DC